jgi:hypothetical protein
MLVNSSAPSTTASLSLDELLHAVLARRFNDPLDTAQSSCSRRA